MRRTFFICSALILFAASVSAQKDKPWTEWTEKDATKVLTDSAWSQTQKEMSDVAPSSGTSGSAVTTAGENKSNINAMGDAGRNSESGANVGQKNGSLTAYYSVAFLTAKPVRQAFVRILELKTPNTPPDKVAERRTFIDRDFGDNVVVTVVLEGTNKGAKDSAMKEIAAVNADSLKTTAYLERKDGKRVVLSDYRPPVQDGLGAKFIFPRTLDGQPFLDANSGELRVNIQIGKTKLNRRFKVAEMMYDGKLEY